METEIYVKMTPKELQEFEEYKAGSLKFGESNELLDNFTKEITKFSDSLVDQEFIRAMRHMATEYVLTNTSQHLKNIVEAYNKIK